MQTGQEDDIVEEVARWRISIVLVMAEYYLEEEVTILRKLALTMTRVSE
jgi:hypothetical protein